MPEETISDEGRYRRFKHSTPSAEKKYISPYEWTGPELQALQQNTTDYFYTQTIDLSTVQTFQNPLEINVPGRNVVAFFVDLSGSAFYNPVTNTGLETSQVTGAVFCRFNTSRFENGVILKHNRGIRGPFNKLLLSWPAQANVGLRLIIHKCAWVPWMGGETAGTSAAALPGFIGDVTAPVGSNVTTVAKIQGIVVAGTTGTGNVVFSTSPTLVNPALGTPSALVGTNITGTAAGLNIGGNAATATFATTAGTVTTNANLTGDVTSVGNATTAAASQPNITTAANLTTVGALAAGSLVAGFTPVIVAIGGTGRATSTAYAVICGGTTATGAQQSIASVGTASQVLTSNGAGALPTMQTLPTNNYYSGSITSGASWTNSTAAYTAGTNSGGNALTQLAASGLTVTAGASNVCGITWTPSSATAVYQVTAAFNGRNSTTGDAASFRLFDAVNSILVDENGGYDVTGVQLPFKLSGIYAPGTGSAVTIRVELQTQGTGGTAQLNPLGIAIYFTVIQIKL